MTDRQCDDVISETQCNDVIPHTQNVMMSYPAASDGNYAILTAWHHRHHITKTHRMARHTNNSNTTVTQHILHIILTQVSSLISTTQLTMMDTQEIITALIDW